MRKAENLKHNRKKGKAMKRKICRYCHKRFHADRNNPEQVKGYCSVECMEKAIKKAKKDLEGS